MNSEWANTEEKRDNVCKNACISYALKFCHEMQYVALIRNHAVAKDG